MNHLVRTYVFLYAELENAELYKKASGSLEKTKLET